MACQNGIYILNEAVDDVKLWNTIYWKKNLATFWKRAAETYHITAKTYVKQACMQMCIPSITWLWVHVSKRVGGGGTGEVVGVLIGIFMKWVGQVQ